MAKIGMCIFCKALLNDEEENCPKCGNVGSFQDIEAQAKPILASGSPTEEILAELKKMTGMTLKQAEEYMGMVSEAK